MVFVPITCMYLVLPPMKLGTLMFYDEFIKTVITSLQKVFVPITCIGGSSDNETLYTYVLVEKEHVNDDKQSEAINSYKPFMQLFIWAFCPKLYIAHHACEKKGDK